MGEIIRKKRKEMKMSQEELAHEMGVTQGSVSQWEKGETMPRTDKLIKLVAILDIDVNELLQN